MQEQIDIKTNSTYLCCLVLTHLTTKTRGEEVKDAEDRSWVAW